MIHHYAHIPLCSISYKPTMAIELEFIMKWLACLVINVVLVDMILVKNKLYEISLKIKVNRF